jgi:hypothetical protein
MNMPLWRLLCPCGGSCALVEALVPLWRLLWIGPCGYALVEALVDRLL